MAYRSSSWAPGNLDHGPGSNLLGGRANRKCGVWWWVRMKPHLMLTRSELSTESIFRKHASWLSRRLTQHLRPSWQTSPGFTPVQGQMQSSDQRTHSQGTFRRFLQLPLAQCFSIFLMLRPFNTVHAVVTPTVKLFLLLLHKCHLLLL